MFQHLQAYLLFFGYPRSGHTLLGSMIDAHPDAIVSHELHALDAVRLGARRKHLFHQIVQRSRHFALQGRQHQEFDYALPGQPHGRSRRLRILGDKRGGSTTTLLARHPEVVAQLREVVGLPLKAIHHVRNPWDMASTMLRRQADPSVTLDQTVDAVLAYAAVNRQIAGTLLCPEEVIVTRHEALVRDTPAELGRIADFLGLDRDPEWLAAADRKTFAAPRTSRHQVRWSPAQIARLADGLADDPFLATYSFDDAGGEVSSDQPSRYAMTSA